MKNYFLLALLVFGALSLKAESDLVVKDPSSYLHYRINLNSKDLSKEQINGQWVFLGKLAFSKVDVRDLKILVNQTFDVHGKIYVAIEGSGQLYRLDIKGLSFSRLDSTYFRGHNFSAIKFIRKDTLYSLGGSGFWHINNIETFYVEKRHEWELWNTPKSDLDVPQQIVKQFGGYDQKRDVISLIESPPFYHKNFREYTYKYFEKNLKSNEWDYIGDVNSELLFKLGLKTLRAEYLYGMYLFDTGDLAILGDPVENKIYLIDKNLFQISDLYDLSERNGFLYSYYIEKDFNNSPIKVDSISFQKLKSIGVYKGKFYTRKYTAQFLLGFLIVGLMGCCLFVWRNKRIREKQMDKSDFLDGMPEGSNDFLRLCLHYPIGHEFDSNQLTEFMGFHIYSYETQRQLRSKLIKSINSYFGIYFKMNDVIIRNTALNDKRYYVYRISEDHYDRLKEMLGLIIPPSSI